MAEASGRDRAERRRQADALVDLIRRAASAATTTEPLIWSRREVYAKRERKWLY